MLKYVRQHGLLASLTTMLVLGVAETAGATATYSLAGATGGIQDQVTSVLTEVLPVAGGIIALFIGWKILRRMVKA